MFSQMEKKGNQKCFTYKPFFSNCENLEFHPLRWNQVKQKKKKSFIFFPLEIRIFFQVEKKENVQKISFARIICPNSVFLVKNMDFYHKTKQRFLFLHLLNWFANKMWKWLPVLFFFRMWNWVKKVSDGVKK